MIGLGVNIYVDAMEFVTNKEPFNITDAAFLRLCEGSCEWVSLIGELENALDENNISNENLDIESFLINLDDDELKKYFACDENSIEIDNEEMMECDDRSLIVYIVDCTFDDERFIKDYKSKLS
jgi:hypothetical protein